MFWEHFWRVAYRHRTLQDFTHNTIKSNTLNLWWGLGWVGGGITQLVTHTPACIYAHLHTCTQTCMPTGRHTLTHSHATRLCGLVYSWIWALTYYVGCRFFSGTTVCCNCHTAAALLLKQHWVKRAFKHWQGTLPSPLILAHSFPTTHPSSKDRHSKPERIGCICCWKLGSEGQFYRFCSESFPLKPALLLFSIGSLPTIRLTHHMDQGIGFPKHPITPGWQIVLHL